MPRTIRVLHVLRFDAVGGTERVVANIAGRMQTDGFSTEVAILDMPGPIADHLHARGVRVASLGCRPAVAAERLARLLRAERYDVVCAYGLRATMLARVLIRAIAPGTSLVVGVRGLLVSGVEDPGGLMARAVTRIERLGSPWVDAYDVNSPGAAEVLAQAGIPSECISYIPNGIDLERWPADGSPAEADSGLIVCVARFTPLKRHQDLVRAAALLKEKGTRFELCLAGDGATMGATRDLVRSLGLEERTRFTGALSEDGVRQLMRRAAIFCLPSRWEGMPGSVLEAMATGVPVVATRVNGISSLVRDGETGLLVQAGRPDLLSEALGRLLNDPPLREQMGMAGRRRAASQFRIDLMIERKALLYRSVAQGK